MSKLISEMPAHAVDAVGIKSSSAATYGASAGSIVATVAGWNWTAIITCAVAVAGLGVQVYFQIRRDRREAAESRARMEALRARCEL
jgi:predicted MFS family arabinose efflux permease